MTPQEIRLVRASFDRLEPRTVQAAELILGHVLRAEPTMARWFEGDPAAQGRRLMQLIGVTVGLLDKPGQLGPVLRKMGERCAGLGITEAHYDTVGAALLRALAEALGESFDAETCVAWAEMHRIVGRTMIAAARAAEGERAAAG
jgi:methyl-accepting chemotaxis protein